MYFFYLELQDTFGVPWKNLLLLCIFQPFVPFMKFFGELYISTLKTNTIHIQYILLPLAQLDVKDCFWSLTHVKYSFLYAPMYVTCTAIFLIPPYIIYTYVVLCTNLWNGSPASAIAEKSGWIIILIFFEFQWWQITVFPKWKRCLARSWTQIK